MVLREAIKKLNSMLKNEMPANAGRVKASSAKNKNIMNGKIKARQPVRQFINFRSKEKGPGAFSLKLRYPAASGEKTKSNKVVAPMLSFLK